MRRIVLLEQDGRRFEFREEDRAGISYWTVYSEGRIYRSPVRVFGSDLPKVFFAALAKVAVEVHGL
jgi:hypothetical protein